MHSLVPFAVAAVLLSGCSASTSSDAAPRSASTAAPTTAPSSSPTADPSTRALARLAPRPQAPLRVEDDQLAGGPYDTADGQAAYLAAVRVLAKLRQDPALLRSGPRSHEDFAEVLAVSTPDHRAYLEKRIAAFLRAQEDPTDTASAELGDELRGAMTIALRPADQAAAATASAGPTPDPDQVRFRSYDPAAGAFGVLSVARTAVYDYEPPGGGTALAVAFDVYAPYNIVSYAGVRQVATVQVTDFRMIMAEDRGEWLWDGWDLDDVSVRVEDRTD